MYKNVTVTLALGFLMGIGFVSCASVESESEREPASNTHSRSMKTAAPAEKLECDAGEERNESGECDRPHEFEHPFHRGGR